MLDGRNPFMVGLDLTLLTAALYLAWRFILRPFWEKYLDHRLERHRLELQSVLAAQRDVLAKQLEVEVIKVQRILPPLEDISERIYEHRMLFLNYCSAIVGRDRAPAEWEKRRVEIDGDLVRWVARVTIYLPFELTNVLFKIRRIVSCSVTGPENIGTLLRESRRYRALQVVDEALDRYSDLHHAFREAVAVFSAVGTTSTSLSSVLEKYRIGPDAEFLERTGVTDVAEGLILLPEYIHFDLGSLDLDSQGS